MSNKWKDKGLSSTLYNAVPLPGPAERTVENTETGETGRVYVGSNQSTGDAIANGQWSKKPK